MERNFNLDTIYFRVKRNGKWQNICCTDLTADEREYILLSKPTTFNISLIKQLATVEGNVLETCLKEADICSSNEELLFLINMLVNSIRSMGLYFGIRGKTDEDV